MPRAIEFDEDGKMVLTPGLAIGPQPGQLSIADLRPADVLVWYSSNGGRISSAIREFSGGPFSHVGVYVGNGYSVDAGTEGVELVPVQELMAAFSYARVMRPNNLSTTDGETVVEAARSFIGRGYAWFDAITLPIRRQAYWRRHAPRRKMDLLALMGRGLTALRRFRPPSQKNTFCSRMVVEAFAAAGYFSPELVEECAFTPNDVAADGYLVYEGGLWATRKPTWHPLDPYSPERVRQRRWRFSLERIFRGTSTGGK